MRQAHPHHPAQDMLQPSPLPILHALDLPRVRPRSAIRAGLVEAKPLRNSLMVSKAGSVSDELLK